VIYVHYEPSFYSPVKLFTPAPSNSPNSEPGFSIPSEDCLVPSLELVFPPPAFRTPQTPSPTPLWPIHDPFRPRCSTLFDLCEATNQHLPSSGKENQGLHVKGHFTLTQIGGTFCNESVEAQDFKRGVRFIRKSDPLPVEFHPPCLFAACNNTLNRFVFFDVIPPLYAKDVFSHPPPHVWPVSSLPKLSRAPFLSPLLYTNALEFSKTVRDPSTLFHLLRFFLLFEAVHFSSPPCY